MASSRIFELSFNAHLHTQVPAIKSEDDKWPKAGEKVFMKTSGKAFLNGLRVGMIDNSRVHFVGVMGPESVQMVYQHKTMGVVVRLLTLIMSGSYRLGDKLYIIVPGKGVSELAG